MNLRNVCDNICFFPLVCQIVMFLTVFSCGKSTFWSTFYGSYSSNNNGNSSNVPVTKIVTMSGNYDVDYDNVEITFDGKQVVYLADKESDGKQELYVTGNYSANSSIKLNGMLVSGGKPQLFNCFSFLI